jgi:hypothetical protein
MRERRHPRRPTGEAARIVVASRFVFVCVIRDISLGGACLELDGAISVPQTLDLVPATSDAQVCRVMWRADDRVGLEFQT